MTGANETVFAAAGGRKTTMLVDRALGRHPDRVLILTYTEANQAEVRARLTTDQRPSSHVTVMGWLAFLLNEWIRPYQRAMTGVPNYLRSLKFHAERRLYGRMDKLSTFVDRNRDVLRNGMAALAAQVSIRTDEAPARRLERIYDAVMLDELQGVAGYDLDILSSLMRSTTDVLMVGDPRQCLYVTNFTNKYSRFRGLGLPNWFEEHNLADVNWAATSWRCSQPICDFADAIFQGMFEPTTSSSTATDGSGYDGVDVIEPTQVPAYLRATRATVLRYDQRYGPKNLPATNIGNAKGLTFDHVLVYGPRTWKGPIQTDDFTSLWSGSRSKLYVAVTRARHSVRLVL